MKKQGNGRKTFAGSMNRLLAVIVCVCMVFGTIGITGCDFVNNITNGFKNSTKNLPKTELARLIANAIQDDSEVSKSYAKIPANQLDELSYSVLSEYCTILRKNSAAHGYAESFRFLSDEEKEEYFRSINPAGDTSDYRLIEDYGEMDVVELCYKKDKDPSAPPVRFTLAKNKDNYALASEYITDSMLAYVYINHYFDMIDEGNVDGLEAVLKASYSDDIYMNSVVRAKANYLSEYYRFKVKTNHRDYQLKLLSPTHIVYVIPEVFSDYGDNIISKNVELRLNYDGTFRIKDDIPSSMSEVRLQKSGETKLRMGSTYTQNEIYRLLGEPVLISFSKERVTLFYRGMTLKLNAEIVGDKWTAGKLTSIDIRKAGEYSLGEDIYMGMNVSELLLTYPMFDEWGYTSSFKNGDGEFTLVLEFDQYKNVSRIRLGESVG